MKLWNQQLQLYHMERKYRIKACKAIHFSVTAFTERFVLVSETQQLQVTAGTKRSRVEDDHENDDRNPSTDNDEGSLYYYYFCAP